MKCNISLIEPHTVRHKARALVLRHVGQKIVDASHNTVKPNLQASKYDQKDEEYAQAALIRLNMPYGYIQYTIKFTKLTLPDIIMIRTKRMSRIKMTAKIT